MSRKCYDSILYTRAAWTGEGNPRYNVMKALNYGEIKFLFTERAQLVYSAGSVIHKLRKKLDKYNDEDFYFLLVTLQLSLFFAVVASEANNGKFKLLKWDRIASKYYPISVDLYNKEEK